MTTDLTTVARSVTLALLGCTLWTVGTSAQQPSADLIITNARVLTGTGEVLDDASVVVTDGRIVSVASDVTDVQPAREIDATGMTVMPGLIDTHHHLLVYFGVTSQGELDQWIQQQLPDVFSGLLARGLTTIFSPGDFLPEIIDIRERVEDGDLLGPRLLTAGWVFTAPDDHPAATVCQSDPFCRAKVTVETDSPEFAREKVREAAAAGVDGIKALFDRTIVPDVRMSDEVFAAIGNETERIGLPLFAHAETVEDMLRAVELGADRLVHAPHAGSIADTSGAQLLRDAGVAISTTVSFDSQAWADLVGRPRSAGHQQRLANIRHLWDEGVTVAFGTDSPPGLDFMAEVRALSAVLSNEEIITALTRNAAVFLYLDDELGTLESGKVADIVIIDGDPLSDIEDLTNVRVVIKGGEVVVDNR